MKLTLSQANTLFENVTTEAELHNIINQISTDTQSYLKVFDI